MPIPIRLVTFDLLHTLVTPRYPIHIQYSRVFEPFLGPLNPDTLKDSFGIALRQLQAEKPVYGSDVTGWWSAVIRPTALGAGADEKVLDASLGAIVPELMSAFSTKEGYKAFDDSLPALHRLHELGIRTAVVSNADSRMLSVLRDLDFPSYLNPILLSESEEIEKPAPEIFLRALVRVNAELEKPIAPLECLHVGDEVVCDYKGALSAGMRALLLERPGTEIDEESIERVKDLHEVVGWVEGSTSYPTF
ncbi:HAD-like domain-containing protein [Roridomyces roridus]|uniref:HAD-like domain-containing protein n=1 Tax=Roridomyces roridus TaxID=1738132 RepID=A0AAD7CF39_9AGAR|nr:HAD-like domain-containing protein [Roridomyces roridus]